MKYILRTLTLLYCLLFVTEGFTQGINRQHLANDTTNSWHRIPAIAKAKNGDLIAVYDYRICHSDVGFGEVDQLLRISKDNGKTWSKERVIADGFGGEKNVFGAAFGDPAIAADRESKNMVLITVSGKEPYPWANASIRPFISAQFSKDNGKTWSTPEDITSQFWGKDKAGNYGMFEKQDSSICAFAGFFGSGKIHQSRIVKKGKFYRLYSAMLVRGLGLKGAYVVFSDDMGHTWIILGGDASIQASPNSDEPKVEELPDGSIILSGRAWGGRTFNIFTFDNNDFTTGHWGKEAISYNLQGGITVKENSCNGEILVVNAKKVSDGSKATLVLQSIPKGKERKNVEIWFKDITNQDSYQTNGVNNPIVLASDWTEGLQVSNTLSAYSTMCLQKNGRIAFFYEEGPAIYSMVFTSLSISEITNNLYE